MGDKMRVEAGPLGEGVEGGTLGGLLASVSEEFVTLPRLGGCTALRGGAHRAAHLTTKKLRCLCTHTFSAELFRC